MSRYVVYRRFNFLPNAVTTLSGHTTNMPPFKSIAKSGPSLFRDVYYDLASKIFTENNFVLRTRNGVWKAMENKPEVFTAFEHRNFNLKREFVDRVEIHKFINENLALQQGSVDSDGIQGGPLPTSPTFNFALKIQAEMNIKRTSYLIDGKMTVHLDNIIESGYRTGLIEDVMKIEKGASYNTVLGIAHERRKAIDGMMNQYHWFFRRLPEDEHPIDGKLVVYLEDKASGYTYHY
ncbi:hypothetical protein L873DRAFT_1791933 [Choiromyces venosus 120613-1]|uniref:Uncharacterized protein n=1 Tax=Choiromyces venosus 120613-1 TaxID=1336337 RepID=A0A3N4JFG6_9PEZI|nr:hypothetical protein L873DRAFT_1791933 [Choiromyces venosus 120613-1]